ncbi:MAG TPA: hypothetical protein PKK07_02870 [bacterium]|nr:hypothetical protein [bacterium]
MKDELDIDGKKPALWVDDRLPTSSQLKEINELGYYLVKVEEGRLLSTVNISKNNWLLTLAEIMKLVKGCSAMFGSPTAKLVSLIQTYTTLDIYGVWHDRTIPEVGNTEFCKIRSWSDDLKKIKELLKPYSENSSPE